ncbi:MAG: inner-membrane translocator [Deltaproteobacteria bacterium]|nr:inner-membrane translocator [Deltaproteobacteria bacterium]
MKILKKSFSRAQLMELVPIFTLIVLLIVFHYQSEAFLTQRNLTNLFRQVSVNCILAFGMTAIILLGAIDLSIGSVLALGSVVAGLMQVDFGMNQAGISGALLTIAAVVGVCALTGAFTGSMVAKFKMPSFVVTLGIFVIARGLALILSGGSKIAPLSESYRWLGTSFVSPDSSLALILIVSLLACIFFAFQSGAKKWLEIILVIVAAAALSWIFYGYQGIPVPVLFMSATFAGIYFLLNKTTFGRSIYAIGGNPEAARLCGIRVPLIFFATFVLMGTLVAFAAIIEGGRIDAGDPTGGNLYELDAIAAVVIGGTSLQGGVGTVTGTLLGAFLMGTLNNGMSLMNIPTNYQMVIKGMIIILAVLMDVLSKNRK